MSVADILAGQNAAFAILAAILHRERTGKGQWIDIALADSCISAMTGVNQFYLTGRARAKTSGERVCGQRTRKRISLPGRKDHGPRRQQQ